MSVGVIRTFVALLLFPLTLATVCHAQPQARAQTKPNILVIFGDDIGQTNISAYSMGLMGYKTPTSTASPRKA